MLRKKIKNKVKQNFHCPDENVKFVIISPLYNSLYPNIINTIDEIYQLARRKYSKKAIVTLLNEQATLKNYRNYLRCKSLDFFYSAAHSDGKIIIVSDGIYDLTTENFSHSFVDYQKTTILFNSCWAFKSIQNGVCNAITDLQPLIYSSGKTALLEYGSTETYKCFLRQVLRYNKPKTKATLLDCQTKWDPTAENSVAPIYFNAEFFVNDYKYIYAVLQTNIKRYYIFPNELYLNYLALHLAANEKIENIWFQEKKYQTVCEVFAELHYQAGLKASQFRIRYVDESVTEKRHCYIENVLETMRAKQNFTHTEYGFYPEDNCQIKENLPTSSATQITPLSSLLFKSSYYYVNKLVELIKKEMPMGLLNYWNQDAAKTLFFSAATAITAKALPHITEMALNNSKLQLGNF